MDWVPVNFDLLKNPLNWFIVVFMVVIGLIPLTLIFGKISINRS